MSTRLLLQLLGFWLLLSRPCGARVSERWLDQVIHVCGRDYVRTVIEICGMSVGRLALSPERPASVSSPYPLFKNLTETVPSFINREAEPFDMTLKCLPDLSEEPKAALSQGLKLLPELQYASALRDSAVSLEGFEKTSRQTQGEAEDKRPPGLQYSCSDAHSRRRRESDVRLSEQCCNVGCTRRSIAKVC
ncbi:prorelaxin 1-like [Meriones unguiculatus]|uniref:prorelaxin 1-like n=1 Tax=Meriones unguiculatus TaxID=10047 RepID=UPI000B4F3DD3|nr:prorelaxin 1-like [Meriones unguiculatus]